MNPADMARACRLLGAPARVRIVELLKGRALCVGALARRLRMSQAAVSQHLRALRDAGAVGAEKRGYFVHYRLRERTVERWRVAIDGLLVPAVRVTSRGRTKAGLRAGAAGRRAGEAGRGRTPKCRRPGNPKGRPQDCSRRQIRQCHGGSKRHPCVRSARKPRKARDGRRH